MTITSIDIPIEPSGVARGRAMVERAQWAAKAFATYDIDTVRRIAKAAAMAGEAVAGQLGKDAVAETGFGVAEHKLLKNVACSIGIWNTYADQDFVSPHVDEQAKLVSLPRPAGVIFALTPSTNPVATVFFNIMLALLTRNTIIISPHPFAATCSVEAARIMAEAAVAAGAPDGCVQFVETPSLPLISALMQDPRVDVIVATGGTPMVRSAYRSGNPALGVGPGNVPVLVDASARLTDTAARLVASKSFDNSILCTNESVLIAEAEIVEPLTAAMKREGAVFLDAEQTAAVKATIFDGDHFNTAWVGKSAVAIAAAAGITVPAATKILVAPFDLVVPEEMLAHEKLCPVLGMVSVPTAARGIEVARAVLRIAGAGHSAAIHSTDARTIMAFSTQVPVLRVSVNVGNSLGSSGIETNLAPSMTIGAGFAGGSSLGANLRPDHLVNHTVIAYNADASVPMADFAGIQAWEPPIGHTPAYPYASNLPQAAQLRAQETGIAPPASNSVRYDDGTDEIRDEIRRMVIEELRQILKG